MVSLAGGLFFCHKFWHNLHLLIFFCTYYNRISTVYLHEFFQNKVGYSQHNSCNGGIMYNIANILPTLRLCPYFLMFRLLHFLYMIGLYVHIPYLE